MWLGAQVGGYLAWGYPERYDYLHWMFTGFAAHSWAGVLEYVSAVDGNGTPTTWTAMPLTGTTAGNTNSDGTSAFTQNGVMHFYPFPTIPWVKSYGPLGKPTPTIDPHGYIALVEPGYYMRVRTTHAATSGNQPYVLSLTPQDYTGSGNYLTVGSIPFFKKTLDTDLNEYIDDTELGADSSGTCRFFYQSRMPTFFGANVWYPNFSNVNFQSWAAYYSNKSTVLASTDDGLFFDDSAVGSIPFVPPTVASSMIYETPADNEVSYGQMMSKIVQSMPATARGPRGLVMNMRQPAVPKDSPSVPRRMAFISRRCLLAHHLV